MVTRSVKPGGRTWPYQVMCLRERDPSQSQSLGRRVMGFVRRRSGQALAEMLATGQAESVFDDERPARGPMAVSPDEDDAPDIVAVGAADDRQAGELLKLLKYDNPQATVYVAPPRYPLMRRATAKTTVAPKPPPYWGMDLVSLTSPAIDASGIRIAVVDTGVDQTHPDLQNVIDEYINFTRESPKDLEGHGTHVCGIIAGAGTRPSAMPGVSNARLLVYKGLANRYDATHYYRALRTACRNANIVNLSLGGDSLDPGEAAIVRRAVKRGVLLVAAMGNEFDNGNRTNYPAALPGVIAVGAVDSTLARADFSNTGPHIGLVAPGVDIWSTIPTYRSAIFGTTVNHDYCDGTSMAAPFVTGIVALLAAAKGGAWDGQAIRDSIPVKHCPGQSRHTEALGAGVLYWPGPLNLGSA
jgi:subtilisin family serine protease